MIAFILGIYLGIGALLAYSSFEVQEEEGVNQMGVALVVLFLWGPMNLLVYMKNKKGL